MRTSTSSPIARAKIGESVGAARQRDALGHVGHGTSERRAANGTEDLVVVHPPFDELPGDRLPHGRRTGRAEPANGLTEGVEIARSVEPLRPGSGQREQLDDELRPQERRSRDPLLIEAVEEVTDIEAGPALREQPEAVGRPVSLSGQERKIVTEDVKGHTLDRPLRALRSELPLLIGEVTQQVEERITF